MFIAVRFTLLMLLLCGFLYPITLTGLGQALFPTQAKGSLLVDRQGRLMGSTLIGQAFTRPEYFHSRPAANAYDASNSGGSNLGATNQKLVVRVKEEALAYGRENTMDGGIPVDAVTASASGLDPHISLANAMSQLPRVAQARHVSTRTVKQVLDRMTEKPLLAERACVNVLRLNIALDSQTSSVANVEGVLEISKKDAQTGGTRLKRTR